MGEPPPCGPVSAVSGPADNDAPRRVAARVVRLSLMALGWLCVGLGVLGAFLPLLPTTPFLLAAAFCFDRSSPRFHRWLADNRFLAPYLEHYRRGCGVPAKTRRNAVVFLWLGLTASAFLWHDIRYWFLLAVIGIAVTRHIAGLKPRQGTGVEQP